MADRLVAGQPQVAAQPGRATDACDVLLARLLDLAGCSTSPLGAPNELNAWPTRHRRDPAPPAAAD